MTLKYAKEVLDTEIAAIAQARDALDESFIAALDALQNCTGRVITCGMGKAGQIAVKISATLASTGTPSMFLHPAEALHGDLGMVQGGDVMLMLSNSGESNEISSLMPFLRSMDVKIVAITGSARSYLAVQSDHVIDIGDITEACPLGLAPSATTTAMLAVGDALALCLMKRRGFRIEDYARRHPAGALGKKTLAVRLLMRVGDAVAVVSPDDLVSDVILAITDARSGAAVVQDQNGGVLGIFCDGDLRRGLKRDPGLLAKPVGEFMTTGCLTVNSGQRAGEVLDILKEKRLGEAPVVDDNGRLVGLVDLKGLLASQ